MVALTVEGLQLCASLHVDFTGQQRALIAQPRLQLADEAYR
jgi:hypothetical protein